MRWRRGEVPISAGTGAPVPWTGGAVLANIQPNPCSTTSSTHAETGKAHSHLRQFDGLKSYIKKTYFHKQFTLNMVYFLP